jgi:oligopeptide/dipeptide ABC transporter ATP-binding protein
MESIPVPGKGRKARRNLPPEEKQAPTGFKGCPFYPRCSRKTAECLKGPIELKDVGDGHLVACLHAETS